MERAVCVGSLYFVLVVIVSVFRFIILFCYVVIIVCVVVLVISKFFYIASSIGKKSRLIFISRRNA